MAICDQGQLRPNPKNEHAYAIIRYDTSAAEDVPVEFRFTVKRVVFDGNFAEAEVRRLNEINQDKGCYYFTQITRVERLPPIESTELTAAAPASAAVTSR